MSTHRDQCQVVTYAPGMVRPRYLGRLGHVMGLTYDFTMPGGSSTLSCLVQIPPGSRPEALNSGRICRVFRGASVVWDGQLAESVPTKDGWVVSAIGVGASGADYMAYYSSYNLDNPVDQAISRGLRWRHTAYGQPAFAGWLIAQIDNASVTITDWMNDITSKQGLIWTVGRFGTVQTVPIPSVVDRLLVCTDPVPRTNYGNLTTIFSKYVATDDGQGNTTDEYTVYSSQSAINQFNAHEIYEDYTADVISPATMSASGAQAVSQNLLTMYTRAAWAGPFTVTPGRLLNIGGAPIDLATETAGHVCRLIVNDAPYGGELTAGAIQFPVGQWSYDEDSQTATCTPLQSFRTDLGTLLSNLTKT